MLSIIMKLHFDNFHGTKWHLDYLDNRINANLNNLMAIDHAARDWLDDTDYLLPRVCTEFPRLSEGYKAKNSPEKPWGLVKEPVYIEPFLDENQLRLSPGRIYEKGVWYYTGYPLTDHHDMAGLPNTWSRIQTLLGLEYRPPFWVNLFNRLKYLEFSDEQDQNFGLPAPRSVISKVSKVDSEMLESIQDSDEEQPQTSRMAGFDILKASVQNSLESISHFAL